MLTSSESLEILEQKERQKKEEQELKEQRKKQREEKKKQKEEEELKKKKEREEKKVQREQAKRKREQAREAKKLEMEKKREEKRAEKNKENNAASGSSGLKQYPTRKAPKTLEKFAKTSDDVCAVCTGAYVDDIDESGDVTADWIQCADNNCAVWSHVDCLERQATGYVCAICFSVFN